MHLFKLAALASLFVAVTSTEIDPNCGSVSTVFVTVTDTPVTKTVTIPLELSPSITGKHDVPLKLQAAVGTSTDVTATSTDYLTLIRVITTFQAISTQAVADKGPYYFTAHDGTTVWLGGKTPPAGVPLFTSTAIVTIQPIPLSSQLSSAGSPEATSYSTVFVTVTSKVYETETLTETVPAVTTSSSVTESSLSPVLSSNQAPLTSAVPPAAAAHLIDTAQAKYFNGLGLSGWNATFRTLVKEKVAGTANEAARILSRQTGVESNIFTRLGTAARPAVTSYSVNATNSIEARQIGAVVVATIDGVVVSWTNNYDGASTTQAPAAIASDPAPKEHLVVTSIEKNALPIYPWDVQPVPVQVSTTSSSSSSEISSFEQPLTQEGILSQPSKAPTGFQDTSVLSLSSIHQPTPTTIITSVVPVLSILPASSTTTSSIKFSNKTSASRSAATATPSCTGEEKFTINFDDLPHFSTSGKTVDIPPIFNPYRKLYFEDHYGYVPPPSDPFLPISPPQLAVYRANQGVNVDGSPDAGLESVGEFGSGPRASDSAYWIDAFSLWLGCENAGPLDCVITINGYDAAHSTRVVSKTVTQPPCPQLVNCTLAFVEFPDDFRNLAGIQILAAVGRVLTAYYIDDVSLGWSNNTCAAQEQRSSAR